MYGDAKGNVGWWATGKIIHNEESRHEFHLGWSSEKMILRNI
jgi:hypothetical protein